MPHQKQAADINMINLLRPKLIHKFEDYKTRKELRGTGVLEG